MGEVRWRCVVSSGCGKSTLLKVMAGLLPPTSGRVVVEQRPVMGPRADIGMMFQQATLLPWNTTTENVVLPIGVRSGRAAARDATARELLELVGLGEATNLYPGELSGGYVLETFVTTTLTVVYAFLIAVGIGFLLGTLVGETKFGERAVMLLLVAIGTMPKVAFAPLFIAWLGFGISSKVALATFIATFPIVVSTAAGLYAANENERFLFKSMGASRLQTLVQRRDMAHSERKWIGVWCQ